MGCNCLQKPQGFQGTVDQRGCDHTFKNQGGKGITQPLQLLCIGSLPGDYLPAVVEFSVAGHTAVG